MEICPQCHLGEDTGEECAVFHWVRTEAGTSECRVCGWIHATFDRGASHRENQVSLNKNMSC